jgi:hypothetical protein
MAAAPYNKIRTAAFLRILAEEGLHYHANTARQFLRYHTRTKYEDSLGEIIDFHGEDCKYLYYEEQAKEFAKLKANTHADWYSISKLSKETNNSGKPDKLWRHTFQYRLAYKLGIIPKRFFGMVFVPRDKVDEIKQKLNPIRSNAK